MRLLVQWEGRVAMLALVRPAVARPKYGDLMKLSIDQLDHLSYHHVVQQMKLLIGWWVRRLVPWEDQMATMAMVRPVVPLRK